MNVPCFFIIYLGFYNVIFQDEAINVDYIYLFTNIIKTFITNFNLQHKVEYQYQALNNGDPNVQVDPPIMGNENDEN